MSIQYGVIIADPPWHYNNNGVRGAAEDHYPVMSIADICTLPVRDLAKPDAVLLLWATWPQLKAAQQVIDAWGFEYVTGMPWVKIDGLPQIDLFGDLIAKPVWGIGFWIRGATEAILIAKRGNAQPPKTDWVGLLCERMQHSRKPNSLYEYAESMPGPYLEMFARRARPGWDVWGNEVRNTVDMAALGVTP